MANESITVSTVSTKISAIRLYNSVQPNRIVNDFDLLQLGESCPAASSSSSSSGSFACTHVTGAPVDWRFWARLSGRTSDVFSIWPSSWLPDLIGLVVTTATWEVLYGKLKGVVGSGMQGSPTQYKTKFGSGNCNNNIYIQFKTLTNSRISLSVAHIGLRLVVAKMNELRNDMGWQKLAVVWFFSAVMSMWAGPNHICMSVQTKHESNKVCLEEVYANKTISYELDIICDRNLQTEAPRHTTTWAVWRCFGIQGPWLGSFDHNNNESMQAYPWWEDQGSQSIEVQTVHRMIRYTWPSRHNNIIINVCTYTSIHLVK